VAAGWTVKIRGSRRRFIPGKFSAKCTLMDFQKSMFSLVPPGCSFPLHALSRSLLKNLLLLLIKWIHSLVEVVTIEIGEDYLGRSFVVPHLKH
jgi:hypothetical protein